jgi:hypothetical protein
VNVGTLCVARSCAKSRASARSSIISPAGFEPTTSGLGNQRSIHLSYGDFHFIDIGFCSLKQIITWGAERGPLNLVRAYAHVSKSCTQQRRLPLLQLYAMHGRHAPLTFELSAHPSGGTVNGSSRQPLEHHCELNQE